MRRNHLAICLLALAALLPSSALAAPCPNPKNQENGWEGCVNACQCKSGICTAGVCGKPAGTACGAGTECASNVCNSGSCCGVNQTSCGGACCPVGNCCSTGGVQACLGSTGACGETCATAVSCPASASGTSSCIGGTVCAPICGAGEQLCDNTCVSLLSNANCGACGAACEAGTKCVASGSSYSCQCDPSTCTGCCGLATPDSTTKDACHPSTAWVGVPASYGGVGTAGQCPICRVPDSCGASQGCRFDAESPSEMIRPPTGLTINYDDPCPAGGPYCRISITDGYVGGIQVAYMQMPVNFPAAGSYKFSLRARTVNEGTCNGPALVDIKLLKSGGTITTSSLINVTTFSVTAYNPDDFGTFDFTYNLATGGVYTVLLRFTNDCNNSGSDSDVDIDYLSVSAVATANSDSIVCGTTCVDPLTDPLNCGSCGNICEPGYECRSGACISQSCLASLPGGATTTDIELSQTTDAACRLTAASAAQSVLDYQRGEDQSFFFIDAGLPSMLIIIDNGKSMNRLPMDPGCSVVADGCASDVVDSLYDMDSLDPALNGSVKPDPDFAALFDPAKFYQGAADDVFVSDGCSSTSVAPEASAAKACEKSLGATSPNLLSCQSCLSTKGYYLTRDGKRVWKGGFLNVYPPKCVLARKLAKSETLTQQTKVRYSVAATLDPGTAKTGTARSALNFILSEFQPNQCDRLPSKPSNAYFNNVNNANKFGFDIDAKPLGEALFNAGQFLQNEGALYKDSFGTGWTVSGGQGYDTNTYVEGGSNNKVAVCSTCQKSAIVVLTDGKPCTDNHLPTITAPLSTYNPEAEGACKPGFNNCKDWCEPTKANWAASVAAMLNNSDLRTEVGMPGTQTAQTYVIALGTDNRYLDTIAKQGGGGYFTAYNATQLDKALRDIIETVGRRAISVAAPSLSTVQTKTGSSVLVPRFIPSKHPFWDGELFRFELFSEFAADCVSKGKRRAGSVLVDDGRCICRANVAGGQPVCDGMWTIDKNKDFVGIDPDSGAVVLADTSVWDSTTNYFALKTPRVAAVPVWAAGDLLKTRNPGTRNLYTAIDTDADGKITAADAASGMFELDPTMSDADLDKLIPYLGLGIREGGDSAPSVCQLIQEKLKAGGAAPAGFDVRMCARVVIGFIRGWDTFNEKGAKPFSSAALAAGSLGIRPSVLGDVFHSSAIRLDPPVSRMPLCDRGFHNQCLRSLYATPTPGDTTKTCNAPASISYPYERYVYDQTFNKKRGTAVLAGANDGMVHAFQYSCLEKVENGKPVYYEGAGGAACDPDTGYANGEELWGFVPPDLLAKLPQLLVGSRHPYMVDSTPMLRDVWVDADNNGKKGCDEYHTVAVIGERRGGTRYTALDVTDPQNPKFLWMFPQTGTPEELTMGETWSEYLPGAPPIGPVRLANGDKTVERWVVMLAGGFDPLHLRGNQLYMVDVWSGQKIWEARMKAGTSTAEMKYPFAAVPALVAWGSGSSAQTDDFNNGFFDTAIIGDVGGQAWVARFHEPGVFGTNPYNSTDGQIVTNWHVARRFEQAQDGNALSRQPFFSLAAAIRLPASSELQAYLGSGDRMNLKQPNIGRCTLDNPLACARGGLSFAVTTGGLDSTGAALAPANWVNDKNTLSVQWALSSTGTATRTESLAYDSTNQCSLQATPVRLKAGASIGTRFSDTGLSCSSTSKVMQCQADYDPREASDPGLDATELKTRIVEAWYNRFVAFRVFEGSTQPFATALAATNYDNNRLTESDLRKLEPFSATPPALASELDKGWFFYYPALDEATATNTTIYNGCVLWSTVQATEPCTADGQCTSGVCLAGGCHDEAKNACVLASITSNAYLYQANAVTGGKDCALTANASQRSNTRVLVPPPPPQEVIQLNTHGQYKTAIAPAPGAEAPPASAQTFEMLHNFGTLEVDRSTHECRHRGNCDQ